ncbi:MAG: hypothetical protein IJN37_07590 [Clostridia bacterium]|nr:hypothetical protein [Clostridia bacterium]
MVLLMVLMPVEILICVLLVKLSTKIRQKLHFNVDEILVWFEAVLPAIIILSPFYFSGKLSKDTIDLGEAILLGILAFGAGAIFVFRWICTIIRNREETHLQIRYAVLWAAGIIMTFFVNTRGIVYYIWLLLFLPINSFALADGHVMTAPFIVIASAMTLASLFCIWGYKREK